MQGNDNESIAGQHSDHPWGKLSYAGHHGKPMTDQGKTLEIWKKQTDGSWKCVADMWSSDFPAVPQ
jgi:ketosteroid isomerase-like protein